MTRASMSVLFDLDDTLYREMDFVEHAMRNVAGFLEPRMAEDQETIVRELLHLLAKEGRGHVFDFFLERRGLPPAWVAPMLYTYRRTRPQLLQLYPDAVHLLEELRDTGTRTGIVTDGAAIVQQAKVDALNLDDLVDIVVLTEVLGDGAEKPATTGFAVALELLEAQPERSVYIANDLTKDFVGPRILGMMGVLVTRGMLGTLNTTPPASRPDHVVATVGEARDVPGLLGPPAF